jgi:ribosomal protein L37E
VLTEKNKSKMKIDIEAFRKKVQEELTRRGALKPCARCGNETFGIHEAYTSFHIQKDSGVLSLGGPAVPAVMIVCNNCGNINFHALGAIGLMAEIGRTSDISMPEKTEESDAR